MSQEEKNQLNELGGKTLRDAGFDCEQWEDYDWILDETEHKGFADFYLVKCWNDSKMINEADATVYKKLVDIDTILGTDTSLQLERCLTKTTRSDIIEVSFFL